MADEITDIPSDIYQADRPIFEVMGPDGHMYRIWSHGKIEGFPEGSIVLNRIHSAIGMAYIRDRVFADAST